MISAAELDGITAQLALRGWEPYRYKTNQGAWVVLVNGRDSVAINAKGTRRNFTFVPLNVPANWSRTEWSAIPASQILLFNTYTQ